MADKKKELTPEEIAAKEAKEKKDVEEKAKSDTLAKEMAEKVANDVKKEVPQALKEASEAEPTVTEPAFKVYDHMVKYKGKFYDAGTKVPVE